MPGRPRHLLQIGARYLEPSAGDGPDLDAAVYRHGRRTWPASRVSSPQQQQLVPALAHWFNHQTHHRGQVHALLTGLVGEAPELDLLFFQRLSAKPAA